ncbi:aminotransferase class V-fold PLP-dependent enzyme [bacterium]|nr:MAG: aminotransferase class V-fold PLP-dependent enzyme [bacterium]
MDAQDPLASFRDRFVMDDILYLDGNSLGRLPKATVERMRQAVEAEWGGRLIRSWGEGWLELPRRVGAKIARLIGAESDEVVACDSTSVNFFKLAHAALANTDRRVVVTNASNFPSDLYLLQGLGAEIRRIDSEDDDAILAALDEDVALLTLSHIEFRSGLRHDLGRLNEAAHAVGARVLWDLSHSVGAVQIELGDADLAVGCAYKYLNGGPGAPAFLYVRRDLQTRLTSPIQGWFGQRRAFDFGLDYTPAEGIGRFLAGTPPILALAAVEPGVDLLLEAGMERIDAKAAAQTEFLIELADARLTPLGFEVATPREPERRGSHVGLRHREAWRITQALVAEKDVIPDFRTPDVLRLGIAPLYTRFVDLVEAVERIAAVVESGSFKKYAGEIVGVT